MYKMNYEPKIAAIENTIKAWSMRNLSLRGKVTVLKALILSKLQYLASVLGKPDQKIIRKVDKIVFKFLWNGSEKLKRKTMIQCREDGGLLVPDFDTICNCAMIKWIYRYIHTENSNWKYLVNHVLKPVGGDFVFKCNLAKDESIVQNIVSSVWKKIVICWCHMHFVPNETISPNDIIWLNSNLADTMQNKKCVEKGLLYAKQFYKGDNLLTFEQIKEITGNSLDVIYYNRIVHTLRMKYCNDEHVVKMDKERDDIVKTILEKPNVTYIGKRV